MVYWRILYIFCVVFIALGLRDAPAQAEETSPITPATTTLSSNLFSNIPVKNQRGVWFMTSDRDDLFGYASIGAKLALSKAGIDQAGPILFMKIGSKPEILIDETTGVAKPLLRFSREAKIMPGWQGNWQTIFGNIWASAMFGLQYEHLRRDDFGMKSRLGFALQVDLYHQPLPHTMLSLSGSISATSQNYWLRARAGYKLPYLRDWFSWWGYTGVEIIASGAPNTSRMKYGIVLGDFRISKRFVTLAGGIIHASEPFQTGRKRGYYVSSGTYMRF